jgi:AraC-like DNA-binding protein
LGQSFSEFINRQRIEAAKALLTGQAGMLEIAAQVGFGSKASFNRAFRAYAGCTPTAYRQQAQAARITS